MEVLNDRVSMLTNFEVLQLLQEVKREEDSKQKPDRTKTLNTAIYETVKYLNTQPASVQTAEAVAGLIKGVAPFKLTAAETMQLINLRPTSITEIQLMVEETEERFKTEERLLELISKVTDNLPPTVSKSL